MHISHRTTATIRTRGTYPGGNQPSAVCSVTTRGNTFPTLRNEHTLSLSPSTVDVWCFKKFTELNSRPCTNRPTGTFQKPLPLRCCSWSAPSYLPLFPLLFFTFMKPMAFQAFKQHPHLDFIGACVHVCRRLIDSRTDRRILPPHPFTPPLAPTIILFPPPCGAVMITTLLGGHSGYLFEWDVRDCVRARVREVGER